MAKNVEYRAQHGPYRLYNFSFIDEPKRVRHFVKRALERLEANQNHERFRRWAFRKGSPVKKNCRITKREKTRPVYIVVHDILLRLKRSQQKDQAKA
jgi:hypothetical protein